MANELCETSCPAQIFCNNAEQEAQDFRRLNTTIDLMHMEPEHTDDKISITDDYEPGSVTNLIAKGMIRQWYEEVVQESAKQENREALLAAADDEAALEAYISKFLAKFEERAAQSGISMEDLYTVWLNTSKESLGMHTDQELEDLAQQIEQTVTQLHEYFDIPLTKQTCTSGPVPATNSEGVMVMYCGSPNLSINQIEQSAQPLE